MMDVKVPNHHAELSITNAKDKDQCRSILRCTEMSTTSTTATTTITTTTATATTDYY